MLSAHTTQNTQSSQADAKETTAFSLASSGKQTEAYAVLHQAKQTGTPEQIQNTLCDLARGFARSGRKLQMLAFLDEVALHYPEQTRLVINEIATALVISKQDTAIFDFEDHVAKHFLDHFDTMLETIAKTCAQHDDKNLVLIFGFLNRLCEKYISKLKPNIETIVSALVEESKKDILYALLDRLIAERFFYSTINSAFNRAATCLTYYNRADELDPIFEKLEDKPGVGKKDERRAAMIATLSGIAYGYGLRGSWAKIEEIIHDVMEEGFHHEALEEMHGSAAYGFATHQHKYEAYAFLHDTLTHYPAYFPNALRNAAIGFMDAGCKKEAYELLEFAILDHPNQIANLLTSIASAEQKSGQSIEKAVVFRAFIAMQKHQLPCEQTARALKDLTHGDAVEEVVEKVAEKVKAFQPCFFNQRRAPIKPAQEAKAAYPSLRKKSFSE